MRILFGGCWHAEVFERVHVEDAVCNKYECAKASSIVLLYRESFVNRRVRVGIEQAQS